jgi:hypothetical protein
MEPEPLFLQRCGQLAALLQGNSEIDLLDIGAILRQLLLDKNKLMDAANKERIKPKFHVGASNFAADEHADKTFWTMIDGIDPEIRSAQAPSVQLGRDDFLNLVVINNFGKTITIRDIIDHAANVAGGVHLDPRPKKTPIEASDREVIVNGYPIAAYHMRAIAKVALRGLQPIIDDVQKRQSAAQSGVRARSPGKSAEPNCQ